MTSTDSEIERQRVLNPTTRAYTVSPSALEQRRTAARKHGLYAAQFERAQEPRGATPWQRRRHRVRHRVATLLVEFPHLRDRPLTVVQQYAEIEMAKGMIFNQLMDGVEGTAASYTRAVSLWSKLGRQLGILSDDAAQPDPLAGLVEGYSL